MYGVSVVGDYFEWVRVVLNVGCNMVLVCNNVKGVEVILDVFEIVCDEVIYKNSVGCDLLKVMCDLFLLVCVV